MAQKPFYNIINYRAYPAGTAVETFTQRLVFDMESSFGTEIRNPWNLLR